MEGISGWACPALQQSSFFLRACTLQVLGKDLPVKEEEELPPVNAAALAAVLALSLPEPFPSASDVQAAGEALQAVVEQLPLPTCAPTAVFRASFAPCIGALSTPAKVALLRVCAYAALPAPVTGLVTACLAQHFASLPPAELQEQLGAASPSCAALVRQWWEGHFGLSNAAKAYTFKGTTVDMSLQTWAVSHFPYDPQRATLPNPTLGFSSASPPEEYFVRGLDCAEGAPPRWAAPLALFFGQTEWLQRWCPQLCSNAHQHLLEAVHAQTTPVMRILAALRYMQSSGDAGTAHIACGVTWFLAKQGIELHWDEMRDMEKEALTMLTQAMLVNPADAAVATLACGAIAELGVMALDKEGGQREHCLQAVLGALRRHAADAGVAERGCSALMKFMMESGKGVQSCLASGALAVVLQVLAAHTEPSVHFSACLPLLLATFCTRMPRKCAWQRGLWRHW